MRSWRRECTPGGCPRLHLARLPDFPLYGIVNKRCTCGRRDCASPGKHPITRKGFHDADTDDQVVESWWRRWSSANIGLVTGEPSGIVVI